KVEVENDELLVTWHGDLFRYQMTDPESCRIQESLFHEKQTLIENCLFGVDINPKSVMICRLRLWVELLKNAYYKNQLPAGRTERQLETLPNIDINIKFGNSLISRFALNADLKEALKRSKHTIDSYRDAIKVYRHAETKDVRREMERLIGEIKTSFQSEITRNDPKAVKLYKLAGELTTLTTQTGLFGMTDPQKKDWTKQVDKLTAEVKKLEVEIEDIRSNKIYENAFEWRFEFPEVLNDEGEFVGFDVVIGNPPYIVLSSFSDNEFKFFHDNYETAYGRINTFAIFLEKVTNLIKKSGVCSLIIPDSLCLIDYYASIRKYLLTKVSITEIIELGGGVFEEAVVPAIIFSFSNKLIENNKIKIGNSQSISSSFFTYLNQVYFNQTPKNSFNLQLNELFIRIHSKIDNIICHRLCDIATIKIGICTGNNDEFISNFEKFENSKKLLQGKDINRYSISYNNLFVNYDRKTLLRARDEEIFLKSEKLLMRQTSDKLILAFDDNQFYTIDSLFIIFSSKIPLKYLLAILNSKLLNWQYQKLNPEKGRVFAQVKIDFVNELPIITNSSFVTIIENISNQILLQKKENPQADTTELERQIDRLVYELYGLTEEEIRVVEGE
ncbi:MAG: Eco57I restriction-modification methylase domain-containing protein, partial [Bacteroidetes bacterium]|nr:Eco57I restriction-modification methylase domain-containing protein [Bacteroidota bacterium]